MFDHIGGVTDDAWNDDLALRKFGLLSHAPLVLMSHVGGVREKLATRIAASKRPCDCHGLLLPFADPRARASDFVANVMR